MPTELTRSLGVAGIVLMVVAAAAPGRAGPGVLAATALGGIGLLLVLGISVANLPLMVGGTAAALVCAGILVLVFVLGTLLPGRAAAGGSAQQEEESAHRAGRG